MSADDNQLLQGLHTRQGARTRHTCVWSRLRLSKEGLGSRKDGLLFQKLRREEVGVHPGVERGCTLALDEMCHSLFRLSRLLMNPRSKTFDHLVFYFYFFTFDR